MSDKIFKFEFGERVYYKTDDGQIESGLVKRRLYDQSRSGLRVRYWVGRAIDPFKETELFRTAEEA